MGMNANDDDAASAGDAAGKAQFRDPTQWKTGDEPITAAQRSYLGTLASEAGEPADDLDSLTKAEAALRIEELQAKTGRGSPHRG